MTAALDAFIEEARGVSIAEAAARLGLVFKKSGTEHPQPCPATGGDDRFSFNTTKNSWNCRGCGVGGRDAIGMAAHVLGYDVKSREGLMESCAAVLARPIPEEGERESEEDRAARLARLEDQRRKNAAEAERWERTQVDFREKERRKARGIYEAAGPLVWSAASDYLRLRGAASPGDPWLRFSAEVTYWHGQDERGQPMALYSGPAMIAPFIVPLSVSPARQGARLDTSPPEGGEEWEIIGCHITWIDLDRPPKFRPLLVDPGTGEILPTKKMRGSKKGGVIPLAGSPAARRWLGGEGIENVLAFARWEGFRADTFYFAAGDLGNMAGPADPKSRFAHPVLKQPDKNGKQRPVMVAGPVPLFHEGGEPDAMVVPDHVDELVLLADCDSERVMTASAMVRAKARFRREGRLLPIVWVPERFLRCADFAEMAIKSEAEIEPVGRQVASEVQAFLDDCDPQIADIRDRGQRTKIPASTRWNVLKKSRFRCVYCGISSKRSTLVIDHVKSVKDGGTNDESNLVAACERCNSGKGASSLDEASLDA